MTEDIHAEANAEQVRVLREALAGGGEAGDDEPGVDQEPALALPTAAYGGSPVPIP